MQYVSVSLKMATVPLIYMRHQYISIMSTSSLIFIGSVCITVKHLNKMHTFVQPRTSLFLATEKLLDAVGESEVPCFTHEIILLGVDMDEEPFVHKEGQGKV